MNNKIPGLSRGIELLKDLSPYIRQCGREARGPWRIENRKLLDYLIIYIEKGEGSFVIDGKNHGVKEGDLFWIPPDTEHSLEGFPPGMKCPFVHLDLIYRYPESHWEFTIPGGMVDLSDVKPLAHPPVNLKELKNLCGKITSHNNKKAGQIIQDICREAERAQPYSGVLMSGQALTLVAEILRGLGGLGEELDTHIRSIEQAAEFFRKNCGTNISVEDGAKLCSLSPAYFRRLFLKHYGSSPGEYLRAAKIYKAKELMLDTTLNLSEIAEATGFATVHSFSRAFKSVEGVSPSQYRLAESPLTFIPGRESRYSR